MFDRICTAFALLFAAAPALADWSFAPAGNWVSETPTAIGVSDDGTHGLHVTCAGGAPFLYANGYPARSGANTQESFAVVVDGARFGVTGEHSPPDGLWTGRPPQALIDALKAGSRAEIVIGGQAGVALNLRGSSRAIGSALGGCGPAQSAATAPPAGQQDQVLAAVLITEECGGAFELAEGSEMLGLLDGDDQPDVVLDWAGVTCADASKGRGAGRCGINMCTISVFLTELQAEQPLLGLKPEIVARGFGRQALRTLALRPSCPDNALECFVTWRWTGTELEAVR